MHNSASTLPLPRRHGDFLIEKCTPLLGKSLLAQLHTQMQCEEIYIRLELSIDELTELISHLTIYLSHAEDPNDTQQCKDIITILNAYAKQLRLIHSC